MGNNDLLCNTTESCAIPKDAQVLERYAYPQFGINQSLEEFNPDVVLDRGTWLCAGMLGVFTLLSTYLGDRFLGAQWLCAFCQVQSLSQTCIDRGGVPPRRYSRPARVRVW
jgi:hypothetical protein